MPLLPTLVLFAIRRIFGMLLHLSVSLPEIVPLTHGKTLPLACVNSVSVVQAVPALPHTAPHVWLLKYCITEDVLMYALTGSSNLLVPKSALPVIILARNVPALPIISVKNVETAITYTSPQLANLHAQRDISTHRPLLGPA